MRNPAVDGLKALASQIIVLHHLMLYTPMAKVLENYLPSWMSFLTQEARYAVQVFLVVGGFLAAQSVSKLFDRRQNLHHPSALLDLVWQRVVRLGKPFWVAVVLSSLITLLVLHDMEPYEDLATPTVSGVLAHFFFLHDILGVQALSAGVWYVAIDLQLYILLALMIFCASLLSKKIIATPMAWMVLFAVTLGGLSLFWINTVSNMDMWGVYFFGSYCLGMFAYWGSQQKRSAVWAIMIIGLCYLAMLVQWRERLLVACATAVLLMLKQEISPFHWLGQLKLTRQLGDMSYSVFLMHYPMCMFISAWVFQLDIDEPVFNTVVFIYTWFVSLIAGKLLFEKVENATLGLPQLRQWLARTS